ncbi:hypothetical protein JEM67_16170 [Serratia sp. PAMC26656]|uniref:hypothetical protein n=1 Tax=Serratia sp. PAMC26656 TaxID=2775909 RepID=UPI0018F788CF|nr:hypothetical protein [Serratia sp. PAMC26656]MBJ7889409.1 hypothetical protein [Serratia sp. PAMC26656]
MAKLTKKEQAWLDELQEVLNRCPSKRLGFYTMGDNDVFVYDVKKETEISRIMDRDNDDFGPAVDKANANLGGLFFPAQVHSTAG